MAPAFGLWLRQRAEARAAGPCPDPNLLAGWLDGSLLPEEREGLESHLATCGRCRTAVLVPPEAAPAETGRAGRPGPQITLRTWVAAAAVRLVAVGLWWWTGRARTRSACSLPPRAN